MTPLPSEPLLSLAADEIEALRDTLRGVSLALAAMVIANGGRLEIDPVSLAAAPLNPDFKTRTEEDGTLVIELKEGGFYEG